MRCYLIALSPPGLLNHEALPGKDEGLAPSSEPVGSTPFCSRKARSGMIVLMRSDRLRRSDSGDRPALCVLARCRSHMAHTRQSRPDSGLGFRVKVLGTAYVAPLCSKADQRWCLGRGSARALCRPLAPRPRMLCRP